jgi:RNA polymerase sigma-70 factor (ECF subfamily)
VSPSKSPAAKELDVLFRRHAADLRQYLLWRTGGDLHRADDLTQDVFLAIAARRRSVPIREPGLAWLYAVAKRRLIDEFRRNRRRISTIPLDEVREPAVDLDFTLFAGLEGSLRSALEAVPREQAAAVAWKLLEGWRFAEIAAALGTTEGAARMLFLRGMRNIQSELSQAGFGP